jgi:hypothetical protein
VNPGGAASCCSGSGQKCCNAGGQGTNAYAILSFYSFFPTQKIKESITWTKNIEK